MQYDKIEKFGKSLIQHGKSNDRIYLMKLSKSDFPQIIDFINNLAEENNYSKIFAKLPDWALDDFLNLGFIEEAKIPKFYEGKTATHFCSKFISPKREILKSEAKDKIEQIIQIASDKDSIKALDSVDYEIKKLEENDIPQLANVYEKVFDTYPFPIFEEKYLKETMKSHIDYFGAFSNGELVAASSAEMDKTSMNAEMTDFATLPSHRGNGLAVHLLRKMEERMKNLGIKTLYTIARSFSPGMNITFAKINYKFGGTLINNTNISGQIESMNIWYKSL